MAVGEEAPYRVELDALQAEGHPVIQIKADDPYEIGGQFFFWEFATAIACEHLRINPFDQPHVQTAKVIAITGAWFSVIFSAIGIVMLIIGFANADEIYKFTGMLYILMPLWYLILVYLFSRMVYWIYNKVAKKFGGIIVELNDKE